MIKFSLACRKGHEFDAWFQSGAAYDAQTARGQVLCPRCGSHEVDKAVMAPAVAKRGETAPARTRPQYPADEMRRFLRNVREEIEAKAEYVGGRFAEEARKIHFDETEPRGIYGEASAEEVEGLAEDGIPVFPMPRVRDDLN